MTQELIKCMTEVCEDYWWQYQELRQNHSTSNRFADIAVNLFSAMDVQRYMVEVGNKKEIEKAREIFNQTKDTLDTYFSLVSRFPEFGDAEIKTEEGYFPDTKRTPENGSSYTDYVQQIQEKLAA